MKLLVSRFAASAAALALAAIPAMASAQAPTLYGASSPFGGPIQVAQASTQQGAPQTSWVYQLFEEKTHDFGNVARGAEVKHRLKVTNPFQETIRLINVGKTCGCTNAKADFTVLKTHEVGYVDIEMDTVKFLGEKKSNVLVTVRFDGGMQQTAQIPIRSFIRSDVVVQPGAADFGTVDLGAGSSQTLKIDYAGRGDWKIEDVQTTNPYVETELVESQRTGQNVQYELRVALKPNAPIGTVRDRIVLRTNDNGGSNVPVLVEANVEPDIVITPGRVPLGNLKPGQQKTVNVVVRGKKPFVISEIACEEKDCFSVNIGNVARNVHVVPLTVKTPGTLGELTERFEVVIAGRTEPIVFEAFGVVMN